MQTTRWSKVVMSADVLSGILNWVCPACGEEWAVVTKSSSVKVSIRRIGVHFGNESQWSKDDRAWTDPLEALFTGSEATETL